MGREVERGEEVAASRTFRSMTSLFLASSSLFTGSSGSGTVSASDADVSDESAGEVAGFVVGGLVVSEPEEYHLEAKARDVGRGAIRVGGE